MWPFTRKAKTPRKYNVKKGIIKITTDTMVYQYPIEGYVRYKYTGHGYGYNHASYVFDEFRGYLDTWKKWGFVEVAEYKFIKHDDIKAIELTNVEDLFVER